VRDAFPTDLTAMTAGITAMSPAAKAAFIADADPALGLTADNFESHMRARALAAIPLHIVGNELLRQHKFLGDYKIIGVAVGRQDMSDVELSLLVDLRSSATSEEVATTRAAIMTLAGGRLREDQVTIQRMSWHYL